MANGAITPTTRAYGGTFDRYWADGSGGGARKASLKRIAELVATTCGVTRALDVGTGEGLLVEELLKLGVNAYGMDVSSVAAERARERLGDRFTHGSVLEMPFADESFESVVSTFCLERLAREDVPKALAELNRVCSRYLFVQIAITPDEISGLNLTVEERSWWETQLFKAGFRKHPAYYRVNDYEALNSDEDQIIILVEKIPSVALERYPLDALQDERNLHMDMTRETGERSDAHIVRYQWAAGYVRPGDRVLDAACGLGYGSYLIRHLSEAGDVVGIDGSQYAIDYASTSFASVQAKLSFSVGMLPEALAAHEDGSFDTIISFETLEHVENPTALVAEFTRLLSPGGRLIVSVPNDWSDESGEDPNPFHLQVYTWDRLKSELGEQLMLEHAFEQTASACKVQGSVNQWERRGRSLQQVDIDADHGPESEWLLMVGMKDPIGATTPYRESVYGASSPPENLLAFERDYRNPWLLRSMVEFPFRARNPKLLARMASAILEDTANAGSPDYAAALAVIGYQALDRPLNRKDVEAIASKIVSYLDSARFSPHGLRWDISLSFLLGSLQKRLGLTEDAIATFTRVQGMDCTAFSPSIGTKIVDAAYEAGMLNASVGNLSAARACWLSGVQKAYGLLQAPLMEFVGEEEAPQQFPTIVAVEFLDSAVRCIKALRWTDPKASRPLGRLLEESRQCWKWMVNSRAETIQTMDAMVRDRDRALAAQAELLSDRWDTIQSMEFMIAERDKAMASQAMMIAERDKAIASQTAMIDDRDEALAAQAAMLEARWELMQELERRVQRAESGSSG